MIDADFIIITGIITFGLCFITWWINRRQFVAIHANMFLMLAVGALSITMFYIGVKIDAGWLVIASRWIWLFVLLSKAVMAVSVLALRKGNWYGRR